MKNFYKFNADPYYPWLLFAASVLTIAVGTWQLTVWAESSDVKLFDGFLLGKSPLIMGLTAWALFWVVCRIVFACRYRPHLPVEDRELPLITVVIPAFNEGAQVLQTVRSIMGSHYPKNNMQVICVDDGSQDDTWSWMIRAKHEFGRRVQLIQQPMNQGKRHALLTAFMQATGEIFVTIDSDSQVLPDTLRHLVSPFVRDSQVGGVAGNVRVLNRSDGPIPKMMEVSFTAAFDFLRRGQSVYGGVFCTPGALSAYRGAILEPHLGNWANQTFMGSRANIGEDRAITNLILGCGYRVVYQRDAVVLTKMPISYAGLRRMLLRWERSNVRESLAMISFLLKPFRTGHPGGGWVRLFSSLQLIRMTVGQAFKIWLGLQLVLSPIPTLLSVAVGCFIAAVLPAVVHQLRYGGWFGWQWAIPYSFFWMVALSWISVWGLVTAPRSGWLTREMPAIISRPSSPTTLVPPAPQI
jgi:hyaluronan synthase